jgi:hypothetical protein
MELGQLRCNHEVLRTCVGLEMRLDVSCAGGPNRTKASEDLSNRVACSNAPSPVALVGCPGHTLSPRSIGNAGSSWIQVPLRRARSQLSQRWCRPPWSSLEMTILQSDCSLLRTRTCLRTEYGVVYYLQILVSVRSIEYVVASRMSIVLTTSYIVITSGYCVPWILLPLLSYDRSTLNIYYVEFTPRTRYRYIVRAVLGACTTNQQELHWNTE